MLAVGELRGLLAAFEWMNGKCDHTCSFSLNEISATGSIYDALCLHFGSDVSEVKTETLEDWQPALRASFKGWLFRYGDLLRPKAVCAMADEHCRDEMVARLINLIASGMAPTMVCSVITKPTIFYELSW